MTTKKGMTEKDTKRTKSVIIGKWKDDKVTIDFEDFKDWRCPRCGDTHQEHYHWNGTTSCKDGWVVGCDYPYNKVELVLKSTLLSLLRKLESNSRPYILDDGTDYKECNHNKLHEVHKIVCDALKEIV